MTRTIAPIETTTSRLCTSRATCRACGAPGLRDLHAFGDLPLANALRTAASRESPEATFPLTLALCTHCSLVQLRETVAPRVLYDEYPYFSSYATSTVAYAEALAAELVARFDLGPRSRVVELGSNDGYLLAPFAARGIPVLGIEPARNVAEAARARGVRTETAFFGARLAARLAARGERCDLLLANNVLAHQKDLPGFVAGIAAMLRPGGHAVLEFPYLGDLLAHGEFDTIYHEHLCYFSLSAIDALLAQHGLYVQRVERLARHGGSLRVTAGAAPAAARDPEAQALLAAEALADYRGPAAYASFTRGIDRTRRDLQQCLAGLARAGQRVAAYGASAKGSTLMMACGIRRDQLLYVADRSPHKQGRLTPGNHVPIVGPERIAAEPPDVLLLLAWNFADEIMAQQAAFRRAGGRFLVPIPEVRFL